MEIYYFGTNGEKVGPVTKEKLSNLIESGVVVESTRLVVNGKNYTAGQIPTITNLINRQKTISKGPQAPPMPGDRCNSNRHKQVSNPNYFVGKSQQDFKHKSKSDYEIFWKFYYFVTGSLHIVFLLALVIFGLGFLLRMFQFINTSSMSLNEHIVQANIRAEERMTSCAIWFIITLILYPILRLFCLFMGSMVRAAEETQASRSILEKIANKIMAEEEDNSETTVSSNTENG